MLHAHIHTHTTDKHTHTTHTYPHCIYIPTQHSHITIFALALGFIITNYKNKKPLKF